MTKEDIKSQKDIEALKLEEAQKLKEALTPSPKTLEKQRKSRNNPRIEEVVDVIQQSQK